MRAYATHYEHDGWTLRRVWCEDCGDTVIGAETVDADEVVIEAVFWSHRLVSIKQHDRSRPLTRTEQQLSAYQFFVSIRSPCQRAYHWRI